MRVELLGEDHPDVAVTLNNLAMVDWRRGDLKRAEERFQQAVNIGLESLGPAHPKVADFLANLAFLLVAKGEKGRAVSLLTEGMNNIERHLPQMLSTGSEKQKRLYMESISEGTSGMVSLHLQSVPDDPQAARLALSTLFRRKGRVLDVMSGQVASLMNQSGAADEELLKKRAAAQAQLSGLEVGSKNTGKYKAKIEAARSEVQALERQISERAAARGIDLSRVSIEAVQAALPTNSALVEIVKYRPVTVTSSATRWEAPHYAAYVLKTTGNPLAIDLGEAKKIEQEVNLLRRALSGPRRSDEASLARYALSARRVDEAVMRPIRKLLENTNQILIAPDGAFNFVPFAALKDQQNHYLAENYTFTYLTSGRDLLRMRERLPSKQGPVVIANPLFELPAPQNQQPGLTAPSTGTRSANFGLFEPLEGIGEEAEVVSDILDNSQVFTGAQATEAVLKQVKAPNILHIATHGFFHSERIKAEPAKNAGLRAGASSLGSRLAENVLSRSGLALAGANQTDDGQGNDGIFTALEASVLDLHGTKLVVLSACETGLGEVESGEGVYGLRRALVLAGAESQMISLWQVNDKATRDLMIAFYENLQSRMGRSEALRQVQLKLIKSDRYKHPYFWAGFILSGQWGPL